MKRSGGVSGAVSLVMIFCILCLVIFSVLTYVTADQEYRLSEKTAQSAEDYYRADYDATVIAAALRNGTNPDAEINWDGDKASFLLPMGDSPLGLDVAVSIHDGTYEILRWRTVYTDSWEPDGSLDLWDGSLNLWDGN